MMRRLVSAQHVCTGKGDLRMRPVHGGVLTYLLIFLQLLLPFA